MAILFTHSHFSLLSKPSNVNLLSLLSIILFVRLFVLSLTHSLVH